MFPTEGVSLKKKKKKSDSKANVLSLTPLCLGSGYKATHKGPVVSKAETLKPDLYLCGGSVPEPTHVASAAGRIFILLHVCDGEFASCTSSHRKALIASSSSATFYFPSSASVELGFYRDAGILAAAATCSHRAQTPLWCCRS